MDKKEFRSHLPASLNSVKRQAKRLNHHLDETENSLIRRLNTLDQRTRSLESQGNIRYANAEYIEKLGCNLHAPRILLAGWYGAENLGDELMMQSVIANVPEERRANIAVLLWDNFTFPDEMLDPHVTAIHYPKSTWDLDFLASHFDTVIWGGGAILDDHQYTTSRTNINTGNLFIRLNRKILARGGHVWCLGLSSNDVLRNEEYIRELNNIVCHADLFSLRDVNSLKVLADSGVDVSRIELCEDLVFAHPALSEEIATTTAKSLLINKNPSTGKPAFTLGLVLLCLNNLEEEYAEVIDALQDALRALGRPYQIELIPFLNTNGRDTAFYERLIKRIADSSHISIVPFAYTIHKLDFTKLDALISYKYHASLIAMALGIPTLSIFHIEHPHYSNKMKHVTQLFEIPEYAIASNVFLAQPIEASCSFLSKPKEPRMPEHLLTETQAWLSETLLHATSQD